MTAADIVLFAVEHPTLTSTGLAFIVGSTVGFVAGRGSRRRTARATARRIEPRF